MGHLTGEVEAAVGPVATTLNGPVLLKASLALRALSSVVFRAPCWMVSDVLYTHTQSSTLKTGSRSRALVKAEFPPSILVTVRGYLSRPIS